MGTTKESQTGKILRLLKQNGYMTNYELNKLCFRYGARIYELRREGHAIVSIHDHDSQWRFVYIYKDDEVVPWAARMRMTSLRMREAMPSATRVATDLARAFQFSKAK